MTILVDSKSYKISNGYLSVDDVANMLSVSQEFVEDSIIAHIRSEKREDQTMISADFVEKLLFGECDAIQLTSDSPKSKGERA